MLLSVAGRCFERRTHHDHNVSLCKLELVSSRTICRSVGSLSSGRRKDSDPPELSPVVGSDTGLVINVSGVRCIVVVGELFGCSPFGVAVAITVDHINALVRRHTEQKVRVALVTCGGAVRTESIHALRADQPRCRVRCSSLRLRRGRVPWLWLHRGRTGQ